MKARYRLLCKTLTGGLLPLSVTLASEDCYTAFLGDDLSSALLHGHSYTAHPVGCLVAAEAIEETTNSYHFNREENSLNIPWNEELLNKFSLLPNISKVFSLGTVFLSLNYQNQILITHQQELKN